MYMLFHALLIKLARIASNAGPHKGADLCVCLCARGFFAY